MRKDHVLLGTVVLMLGTAAYGTEMCGGGGCASEKSDSSFSGVVLETTNASRYTYVQINTGKETIWVAGPAVEVKVGDRVTVEGGMAAKNFKSKTLNRSFESLYLAGSITPAGSKPSGLAESAMALPSGHPPLSGKDRMIPAAIPPIQRPDGAKTVAEIWTGRESLSGKTVVVRANVVKVSSRILKMNWLHLRDGTGIEGQNDLVVTTKADVKVGEVVTVSGTLATKRDFGSGYNYEVILEDATLVTK
jgi:hypothetical protein